MKKFIIVALIGCLGCLTEKNVDPGTPATFIKYFNGGFDDVAQDIKATSDGGYILLATSEVRDEEAATSRFKIKLIKTDAFGNQLWKQVYPEYGAADDGVSLRGRSLAIRRDGAGLESGYVVVGDRIQDETSPSYLHIMLTNLEGEIDPNGPSPRSIKPTFEVQGRGVAINSNGNYVVLGSAVNSTATKNMFLAELSPDLDSLWSRTYGAGTSNLTNRLFFDAQSSLYWSGTVTKNNRSDIRFVKTPLNSENTEFDLLIGTPTFNESGNDICSYGYGFAVIGTTDESGDEEILFKRLAPDGTELASKTFGFPLQAENGLSICQARDGGLILLGSVDTNIDVGRGGKDYFLIKINAFGDTEWSRIFGSKNDDLGSDVLANADGSYTIFGTTVWGGLRTLSLIKTDSQGQIE